MEHPGPVIIPSEPTVAGLEGSYRVIRLLGRGTMASVYLAEQVSMARPVALKILSPSLAADPEFVERFLREARASARLNHPNIVAAIDFGEFDSRFFLAMEFVDGQPLSAILARDGMVEEERVITIGQDVLSALAHAKEHGVIHLDVKPANIMICKDGGVKLADFGLAMILEHPGAAEASRRAVGTPYYMAPEQVEGGKLDWRTDQYSLGASLYEAVTGTKPFQGNSVSDILVKRFFEKPVPAWRIGRRRTSRAFSAVLAKMLARSPDSRYQTIADLESDFSRVKAGRSPHYAKLTSVTTSIPSAASWSSLGLNSVVGRINGLRWQQRWNWLFYTSALFLLLLAGYAGLHARELMGPTPPGMVRYELVTEAENPGEDISAKLRETYSGAYALLLRAEKIPSLDNIRRALYSLRMVTDNPDFRDTAYAATARRRIATLEAQLKRMGMVDNPATGGLEVEEESP
ncbi:MAG: serine/threonine protein kinase [Planctomycetaceae bacterium]|nr:serine/threonine protein kinase [Planctomycetaceae bacterium]